MKQANSLSLKRIRIECQRNIMKEYREAHGLEMLRYSGYCDACNNYASKIAEMDNADKEENRMVANHNIEKSRRQIARIIKIAGEISFLITLRKFAILIILPPVVLMSMLWLLIKRDLNPLIITFVIIGLTYILQWIVCKILDWRTFSAYYDHGFAEGILELSDWRNINGGINLDKPIQS